MNREDYIEKLNVIFSDNESVRDVFTEQINNYYNVENFYESLKKSMIMNDFMVN